MTAQVKDTEDKVQKGFQVRRELLYPWSWDVDVFTYLGTL